MPCGHASIRGELPLLRRSADVAQTGSRQTVRPVAGCQPATQQIASLRYVCCEATAVAQPGHALPHFQSSGDLHKPAFAGFNLM